MVTNLYCPHEIPAIVQGQTEKNYALNQNYLFKLGFNKLEPGADPECCVFRYCTPQKTGKGFDLIFSGDYGIVTVEEFATEPLTGSVYFRNTIVGMFQIECTEDLQFIFSKNIRLRHTFKTALNKISRLI
jgi:hypothetical protein